MSHTIVTYTVKPGRRVADPKADAAHLMLLIDRALAASANDPGVGAGRAARELALRVIDDAASPASARRPRSRRAGKESQ